MTITIRKMEKTDRAVWVAMRQQLWHQHDRDVHVSEIDKMLSNNQNAEYIALLVNQQAIGFAEICLCNYANGCRKQPIPFLEGIWVNPEYCQQGLGRALLNQITTDLILTSFDELCSDTDISNKPSQQAHENWGFDEIERVICFRKKLI